MGPKFHSRIIGDVFVIDFAGKLKLGKGTMVIRHAVRNALQEGARKIVLNFTEVTHISDEVLGQLEQSERTTKEAGGNLKILLPLSNKKVRGLKVTAKIIMGFDTRASELEAITSF